MAQPEHDTHNLLHSLFGHGGGGSGVLVWLNWYFGFTRCEKDLLDLKKCLANRNLTNMLHAA